MNKEIVYYQNGIILQKTILEPLDFIQLEFQFTDLKQLNDQLLVSIAAMYMVFKKQSINYVVSSYTLQKFVLYTIDFTTEKESELIETILGIISHMGLVHRLAEEMFYVDGKGGILETNTDDVLGEFQVTACYGASFLKEFSNEFISK